jgi:hypothetical protein
LVKSTQGQSGEIVACINPDKVTGWKYQVQYSQPDGTPVIKEATADSIESRVDMRWLAQSGILAVIPAGVTDSLNGYAAFFERLGDSMKRAEQPIRAVVCWDDTMVSVSAALGCLAVGVLFIWLQRAFFAVTFLFLFINSTEAWLAFMTWRRASALQEDACPWGQARADSDWWFFIGGEPDDVEEATKSIPESKDCTAAIDSDFLPHSGQQVDKDQSPSSKGGTSSALDKWKDVLLMEGCCKRPSVDAKQQARGRHPIARGYPQPHQID